jgi:hypothetical protein
MHVQLIVLLLVLADLLGAETVAEAPVVEDPLEAETEAEAPLAEDRQVSTE